MLLGTIAAHVGVAVATEVNSCAWDLEALEVYQLAVVFFVPVQARLLIYKLQFFQRRALNQTSLVNLVHLLWIRRSSLQVLSLWAFLRKLGFLPGGLLLHCPLQGVLRFPDFLASLSSAHPPAHLRSD